MNKVTKPFEEEKPSMDAPVGKRIDYIRRKKGLSQKDLGKAVGVEDKTIKRYENNKIKIPIDINQLANVPSTPRYLPNLLIIEFVIYIFFYSFKIFKICTIQLFNLVPPTKLFKKIYKTIIIFYSLAVEMTNKNSSFFEL